jgi:hypothetical protein
LNFFEERREEMKILLILVFAVAVMGLCVSCGTVQKKEHSTSEHPTAEVSHEEHPTSEHAESEHPKAEASHEEHPKSEEAKEEHSESEHPQSEHPN